MSPNAHPVEKEEVMAFVDAELGTGRAAAVSAHVSECAECGVLAQELRALSQEMKGWAVERSSPTLHERVMRAQVETTPARAGAATTGSHRLFGRVELAGPGRWWLAVAATLVVALVTVRQMSVSRRAATDLPSPEESVAADQRHQQPSLEEARQQEYLRAMGPGDDLEARAGARPGVVAETGAPVAQALGPAPARVAQADQGPMIIRTAALTILTREFEKARSEIERALREVNGHVAQLTTSGNSDSGRSLNAMLRVPSDQLDSLLARLKSIGPVLEEAQRGQEVTSEFVDLVARLGNARNTEQRLIDVLRTRTGKVSDILEVEREIARVRGEIEQMEAQRKSLETRVRFATVQLDLREDYKVPLEVTPPSAGTQLWNSLVEGYRDAVGSLIDATLFVLRYAPLALLWSALLFWPARSAWRRLRTALS